MTKSAEGYAFSVAAAAERAALKVYDEATDWVEVTLDDIEKAAEATAAAEASFQDAKIGAAKAKAAHRAAHEATAVAEKAAKAALELINSISHSPLVDQPLNSNG